MKTYSNILDLKSIRLKIIEDCNWTCKFCHNEWDIEASSLQWDSMLEEALKSLKEQLNITEVHLTWWEPTLNRNLPNLVVGCNKIWLDTKLTTNWQFSSKYAKMLWESWLSSINFSIQSLNPIILNNIMKVRKNILWAEKQIDNIKNNILFIQKMWIKTKINCVISWIKDINRVQEVLEWGFDNNIETRILDDLNNKKEAELAINKLISLNKSKCVKIIKDPWSSWTKFVYEDYNKNSFIVKKILPVFLKEICYNCDKMLRNNCKEWFYTIRMQKSKLLNTFIIILCTQMNLIYWKRKKLSF